jgi:hypothetical protein
MAILFLLKESRAGRVPALTFFIALNFYYLFQITSLIPFSQVIQYNLVLLRHSSRCLVVTHITSLHQSGSNLNLNLYQTKFLLFVNRCKVYQYRIQKV